MFRGSKSINQHRQGTTCTMQEHWPPLPIPHYAHMAPPLLNAPLPLPLPLLNHAVCWRASNPACSNRQVLLEPRC